METGNFLITKLEQSTIKDILKLQKQAIDNGNDILPSSEAFYQRAFQYENFVYGLLKCDTNELLGFCNCSIPTRLSAKNLGKGRVPDNELDFVGHINTVILEENYIGQGYGKQIIQKVLDEFKLHKIKYIYTTVSPNNTRSMRLFTHFNFSVIENITYSGRESNILIKRELL